MSGQLSVQPMDRTEARRLTEQIKADVASIWRNLLALYEGQAHAALGYTSWQAYCAAEFDVRKSQAYRWLDAGRVVASLEAHSPNGGMEVLPPNERVARAIHDVSDGDPEFGRTVWAKALDRRNGAMPTAQDVTDVAIEMRRAARPAERPERSRIRRVRPYTRTVKAFFKATDRAYARRDAVAASEALELMDEAVETIRRDLERIRRNGRTT